MFDDYPHRAAMTGDEREAAFDQDVRRLHGLGWRGVAAFLREICAARLIRTEVESKLRDYRDFRRPWWRRGRRWWR